MIRCVRLWTETDRNSYSRREFPSYGVSLIENADLLRRVRAETAQVLQVENI